MHARLSVSQICFPGQSLAAFADQARALDARRISFISPALMAEGGLAAGRQALATSGCAAETIMHPFMLGRHLSADPASWEAPRAALSRVIDMATELGARSIYMVTGGHGDLEWEEAAACFRDAVAPCVDEAKAAGVPLMIESAGALYADVHIAHSLADAARVADMAGIGLCVDLFTCWTEAGLAETMRRAMPGCRLIQVSDYVYGDRSLPSRAVPGDGDMPLERLIGLALDAGYDGVFDLELIGPRIDAEGAARAVARAANWMERLLAARGI